MADDMNDAFVRDLLGYAAELQKAGWYNSAINLLLRRSLHTTLENTARLAEQNAQFRTVDALTPGDRVDLEGDPYADPWGDHRYDMEYFVVAEVVRETPHCISVSFDGGPVIGFPPDHPLPLGEHDKGYDEP